MTLQKALLWIGAVTLSLGAVLYSGESEACKNPDCKRNKNHAHKHGKGHGHHVHKHGKASKKLYKHAMKMSQNKLLRAYDQVRLALAADSLAKAKSASKRVIVRAGRMKGKPGKQIVAAAKALQVSKNLAAARLAFGQLSKHTIAYLKAHPKYAHGVQAFSCPMAKGYKKWIQIQGKMANPYMGKRMLMCGSKTKI